MSASEPDARFEHALVALQHIGGDNEATIRFYFFYVCESRWHHSHLQWVYHSSNYCWQRFSEQGLPQVSVLNASKFFFKYKLLHLLIKIVSLAFDALFDFYSPIVLIHKGLFYSDSVLATVMNVKTFSVRAQAQHTESTCHSPKFLQIIESLFLAEVVLSYFICVYYRRCVSLLLLPYFLKFTTKFSL